ncbi:hypothetical protein TVAG_051560 [Trichomonas vaginalis G3]|uniref:Peptidase M60 domain-containing protein n=1 Tax=Trichomonas vaginalis (strain ATCC PRA-98 / G3) TaxID=412133 RepID=A2EZ91_TRIV3|nr:N-terminal domain of M60-like peptidases family [Trichomonas vaginalis G3]EAY02024.1 hypothetical protein TVAG_051560 [Trichomonas vaginalis G3]KAI5496981.1 N-terminal domain of M60-like peptidases family [Trichomonas vaginalis G3]|eukprot:XP_001330484.1 hypothetical protein [Trichomonas vaginalis G3]
MTQDDLFYHPAGIKQFNGDEQKIQVTQRYKFKVVLNTRVKEYHWTAIYVPPGERITVEIPKKAVNYVWANINRQVNHTDSYNERLKDLKCQIKMTNEVNKFGWPYGGNLEFLTFVDYFPSGLEIYVTGGIRMPHFQYGVTTEEEWEDLNSNLPAPVAVVDCGNMLGVGPSEKLLQQSRLNDALAFWRSVGQIFYSLNDVYNYPVRADGRIKEPIN